MNELNGGSIQKENIKEKYQKSIPKVILLLICILVIFLVWQINSKFFSGIGRKEFVELNGVQIPTLYKYTEYDDIVMSINNIKISEDGVTVNYSIVHYKEDIPQRLQDIYTKELTKLGYEYIEYQGSDFWVLNIDNDSKFIYIMISENQVKYGVCYSGRYEEILI